LNGVSVERNESPPKTTAAAIPYRTGFRPFPENALANLFTDAKSTNAPAKKHPMYIQKYLIAIIIQRRYFKILNSYVMSISGILANSSILIPIEKKLKGSS
jgi:hypothetical protein